MKVGLEATCPVAEVGLGGVGLAPGGPGEGEVGLAVRGAREGEREVTLEGFEDGGVRVGLEGPGDCMSCMEDAEDDTSSGLLLLERLSLPVAESGADEEGLVVRDGVVPAAFGGDACTSPGGAAVPGAAGDCAYNDIPPAVPLEAGLLPAEAPPLAVPGPPAA